jgi:hypothetical protein
MKKLIFLVLALAVIWAIPDLRNRVGVALLPLLERLGPVGERVADPVRAFKARNHLSFILRIISDDEAEKRQLPDAGSFKQWMSQRMPQESPLDPWGNEYWLTRRGTAFTVGSNGPDAVRATDDDVIQEASI